MMFTVKYHGYMHLSVCMPDYRFLFTLFSLFMKLTVWFRWLKRWKMQTKTRRRLTGGFLTLVSCTRVNQLQQFSTLGMLELTTEHIIHLLYDCAHQTWNVK